MVDDRKALAEVGQELGTLYGDPNELLKHARVVPIDEVQENDFNLNIPRYVDTLSRSHALKSKMVALTLCCWREVY